MKELRDAALLQALLEEHRILDYFDTPGLCFQLLQYERGETITDSADPRPYLLFKLSGRAQVFGLRQDGSVFPIGDSTGFSVLGDLELCAPTVSSMIVAKTRVRCIALERQRYRDVLLRDRKFLRFLCGQLSEKLFDFLQGKTDFSRVEERLLADLRSRPDGRIDSVEEASFRLHCSLRQLHRALSALTASGQLEHVGKGRYRLACPQSNTSEQKKL